MHARTPLIQASSSQQLGISAKAFDSMMDMIRSWVERDIAPAVALGLAGNGFTISRGFGRMKPGLHSGDLPADAVFLTASLTKPVTCTAIGQLVERGLIQLQTRVQSLVPEFSGHGKEEVTVHHLLTHTSGLPDMIPENMEYRKSFRPLSDFINRICTLELLFPPGTGISYQSTGIAMLGEIVHRVTGRSLPQFLQQELFETLGMCDTSLGLGDIDESRIPAIRVPEDQMEAEWHWNRRYWRTLGAPWGGMFSTVNDMNIFLQTILNHGKYGKARVLAPQTVKAMTSNHTDGLPGISAEAKGKEAWGLGWRLNQPIPVFGTQSPASALTFGHFGATGTMNWADPATGYSCAVFTTQPSMCGSSEFQALTDIFCNAVRANG